MILSQIRVKTFQRLDLAGLLCQGPGLVKHHRIHLRQCLKSMTSLDQNATHLGVVIDTTKHWNGRGNTNTLGKIKRERRQ